MPLTHDEKRRYARHIVLESFGEAAQERLCRSSALVIGAGGLGSSSLSYLAAAGIGRLGMVDDDRVELSNLQRQILHETGDIGRPKVQSAEDRITELNPLVRVEPHALRLTEANAAELIGHYDIVLDGSDNFETRFLVNRTCHRLKKTLVSAALRGFEGQLSTFKSYLGAPHPCYQCLVPELPPVNNNCSETGVIGPLCGVLGSLQALEAIKELTGIGESLSGKLLRMEMLSLRFKIVQLPRNSNCSLCYTDKK
jgi:adenylyltransferase/sulfurtransferase